MPATYQPHDAMIGYVVFLPDHLTNDRRVKCSSTSGIQEKAECIAHNYEQNCCVCNPALAPKGNRRFSRDSGRVCFGCLDKPHSVRGNRPAKPLRLDTLGSQQLTNSRFFLSAFS